MIRMIQSTSSAQAKAYFSQTDYYLSDQELPGQFLGQISDRLGLSGVVDREAFAALCDNRHPLTGKALTPRTTANRTVGYDCSFHPPKSVSILHVLSDDGHILKAFQASVRDTMLDMERDVQTRVRKQGQDEDRLTGELLWTEFIHQTSRPVAGDVPDMHLHCHNYILNLTWDESEQRFKAAQFRDLKRDMPFYQQRFYKRLSDHLIDLGYQIRPTRQSFEVVGVPKAVIDLFSKRTRQIEKLAQKQGITDAEKLDQLGARTRGRKRKELSLSELKQDWRKQIYALGLRGTETDGQPLRYAPSPKVPSVTAQQCIDHALNLRLERVSVVQDRRLLEAAYRYSLGHRDISLKAITDTFEQDQRIITVTEHGKPLCTTRQVLAEERQMVALARQGQGALVPLYVQPPALKLDGEQAEAVQHILTSCNRVSIIQGRAGTGKTTLMKEAVRLIEASGKKVFAAAPTSQASRGVLREDGFTNAETVAQLLSSPARQAALLNEVLWVDEAGLLGTKDMVALLKLVTRQNARLILSGDTRQHASVIRGDALRILNTVAGIPSAQISRIFRQKDPRYRTAVEDLSQGNVQSAFERLSELNAIQTITPQDGYTSLAKAYAEVLSKGRTALAICPTHQQGALVSEAIRQELRQTGRLAQEEFGLTQLISPSWTEAEKSDYRHYQIGQIIEFNRSVGNLSRGSCWQIKSIHESGRIEIENGSETYSLPLESSSRFEVYQPTIIPVAVGDRIRITRNHLSSRVYNGQILDVIGIDKTGQVKLKNKASQIIYTLPRDFGHIAYAYCLTSHAAQGKTVDEVFIAMPAASFAATNVNQFYVSVSRARDRVHLYTDDKEALLSQASHSGDRVSAMELIKHRKPVREAIEHAIRAEQPVPSKEQPLTKPIEALDKTLQQRQTSHAVRPKL